MQVIFCTNYLPGSLAIRAATWSKWSHCGIVLGDTVIHSTTGKGVHSEPLQALKDRYQWEIRTIPGDGERAYDYLNCKYDWDGVFGHWFGAWNDPDKWFCSELVAHCSDVFNREWTSRITPQHCYMVSHALTDAE